MGATMGSPEPKKGGLAGTHQARISSGYNVPPAGLSTIYGSKSEVASRTTKMAKRCPHKWGARETRLGRRHATTYMNKTLDQNPQREGTQQIFTPRQGETPAMLRQRAEQEGQAVDEYQLETQVGTEFQANDPEVGTAPSTIGLGSPEQRDRKSVV